MQSALICFVGENKIDPSILAAVESADAMVANSQKQLIEQSLKTKEAAELMLQAKNQQFLELNAENEALRRQLAILNSQNQKLSIVQQEEIAALKAEADMAKKLLAEQTERAAANEQKLHLQLLEAIKSKEEAVRLTAKIGEDRVAALKIQADAQMASFKQQVKATAGRDVHALGHYFAEKEIKLLALGEVPQCSCHPGIYNSAGFYYAQYLNNPGLVAERRGAQSPGIAEAQLRIAFSKALVQQTEDLKRIAS